MNWMENLLIIAGVSLDIFAAMECQGSLVAKINKKKSDSDLWNRCAGTADYVISGAFFVLPVLPLPVGAGRKTAGTDYIHGNFYDSWHPADGKSNPKRTCGRTSGTSSWNPEICPHGMYQWNLHAAYGNCIWISGNECAYDSDHDCCMYRCICDRRHLYRIPCRI